MGLFIRSFIIAYSYFYCSVNMRLIFQCTSPYMAWENCRFKPRNVHTPESFMFTPFPQHEFFDFSRRRIIISGAIKVLSCWENVSIFFFFHSRLKIFDIIHLRLNVFQYVAPTKLYMQLGV